MIEIILTHKSQVTGIAETMLEMVERYPCMVTVKKRVKCRTGRQNRSMHKYFSIMAERMNDAGITQRQLIGSFKDGFELPVTEHMVKDIFREVGRAMFRRESTADLTTVEAQEVYQVVDQRFGEVTGVRAEWPSSEPPAYTGVEE